MDVLLRPTMVGILRCGSMLPPQLNLVLELEFADAATTLWSENAGAHGGSLLAPRHLQCQAPLAHRVITSPINDARRAASRSARWAQNGISTGMLLFRVAGAVAGKVTSLPTSQAQISAKSGCCLAFRTALLRRHLVLAALLAAALRRFSPPFP